MEANKKAKELVIKYYSILSGYNIEYLNSFFSSITKDKRFDDAKQCAIIAVDEILKTFIEIDPKLKFWQQVKTEITNL